MFSLSNYFKTTKVRRYLKVAAYLFVGIAVGCLFVSSLQHAFRLSTFEVGEFEAPSDLESEPVLALSAALPVRLTIPAVKIDTTFEGGLGVDENNEIEVPDSYEEIGWYEYGPTPGEIGPAVVLGHVDSYEGPAVFYNLREISVGDEVFIDREDGTRAVFTVIKREEADQNDFPTAEVYGDLDYAGLRLITCTGVYSHSELRYSHNLVVFAELTRIESTP